MRFDFSVGFVNVSEEMEARFDTEYTTEQRDIAVVYSIRNVQYAIGWLVGNEYVCIGWNTLITSSYSPLSSSATNMGNGKLKGEALSKFIKRSVEMIG